MDKNQAKKNAWFATVLKRKRKFVNDMTYNDQAWNHAAEFQDEWIDSIKEHQSWLIPIDAVEDAKQWFEYLPRNPPSQSRYRCKTST